MRFNFVIRGLLLSMLYVFFINDTAFSQERYYWSGKRKIPLSVDSTSAFVVFKTSIDETRLQNQSMVNKVAVSKEGRSAVIHFKSPQPNMRASLNSMGFSDSQIESYQTGFKVPHNTRVWLNDEIILEMRNGEPIESLKNLAQGFLLKSKDKYGVTVLKSTNRSMDAAEAANKIYESGLVKYCHPNFVMEVIADSDPLYPEQYYLNNTGQVIDGAAGQPNIDVNGPEGWAAQVASPSIKVAVIDDGVEDHDDLRDVNGNSRVLNGYTIGDGNGRPIYQTTTGHGQACAGIVAASHNNIAIRGVAPNVQIVPINIFTQQASPETYVAAYRWAWETAQVDVMSNSYTFADNDAVTAEIGRVRTLGRGGKGCLFVKSAGNTGGPVTYPGYVQGVIAVAAVNKFGQLSGYSARGENVDIAAPSSGDFGDVRTLSLFNGTTSFFGGTSAACPQVSGIAALILSINPALTESAVSSLITSTARNIGVSGIGSGLANGYVAVKRTLELYGGTINGYGNLPSYETWNLNPSVNLSVNLSVARSTRLTAYNITFQRATGSSWGGVSIYGDNADVQNCIFDGGGGNNYMVNVFSRNNTFAYCTFKNATDYFYGRGFHTDFSAGGGRSSVFLYRCNFQNNRTGLVLYNCDASMLDDRITNNTSVGIYLYNATLNTMGGSLVEQNVTNLGGEGERGGIENLGGSALYLAGGNAVRNNYSHEIVNDGGSYMQAIYSSIFDIARDYFGSSGRKYIFNQNSGLMVSAQQNYWGEDPVPEMFIGAVDYSGWLPSNPTGYSAPPDNLVMQSNNARSADEPLSLSNAADEKDPETDARRNRINALLAQLRQTPDAPQNYRLIAELHGLALLDKDDKTGQRAAVFQALSESETKAVAFRRANTNTASRETHPTQRAGEQAALATINLLIKQDRYDEARQKLAQAKSIVERKESQLSLLMSEATLEEQAGRFQTALEQIQNVRRLAAELSGNKSNHYEIAEQNLRQKLGNNVERGLPTVAATSSSSDKVKSDAVELSQNYPNPFNPSTVISYQLPASSVVSLKIYDMLGREVQTLVNETQAAGRYAVGFNASGLASGTYFYKLQAVGSDGRSSPFIQTKKLTLVK